MFFFCNVKEDFYSVSLFGQLVIYSNSFLRFPASVKLNICKKKDNFVTGLFFLILQVC